MTKRQRIVCDEWLFVVKTAPGGKGPVTVTAENIPTRHKAFAGFLARLIAAWLNGERQQVRLK